MPEPFPTGKPDYKKETYFVLERQSAIGNKIVIRTVIPVEKSVVINVTE